LRHVGRLSQVRAERAVQVVDPQLGARLPVSSSPRLVQLGASFAGKPDRLAHRVGAACNSARTVSQATSSSGFASASRARRSISLASNPDMHDLGTRRTGCSPAQEATHALIRAMHHGR